MIKDIVFVLMVLCVSIFAHTNRLEIINFIEVYEQEASTVVEISSE